MNTQGPGWLQHQIDGFIVFYPTGSVVERWLEAIEARLQRVQRRIFRWIEPDNRPILVYLTDPVVSVTWPGITALTEQLASRSDLVWQSFSTEQPAEDLERRAALALLQRDRPLVAHSVILGIAGLFAESPAGVKRSKAPFNDQSGDEVTSLSSFVQRRFGSSALDRFAAGLLQAGIDPANTLGFSMRDLIHEWRKERTPEQATAHGMWSSYRHALSLLRTSRLLGSTVSGLIIATLLALAPLLVRWVIEMMPGSTTQEIIGPALVTFAGVLIFALVLTVKTSTDTTLVARVQQESRQHVLTAVQQARIDPALADVRNLNRRVQDAETAGDATRHVPVLIQSVLVVVATCAVLFYLQPALAAGVLIACLICVALLVLTGKRGIGEGFDLTAHAGRMLEELISAQRLMRSYSAEAFITERVTHGLRDTARPPRSAASTGIAAFFVFGVPLSILFVALMPESGFANQPGTVFALILAAAIPIPALVSLSNALRRLEAAGPTFQRLEAATRRLDEEVDDPIAVDIATIQSSIRFDNVHFNPAGSDVRLRGVSFAVTAGSHVAVLTSSGLHVFGDLLFRLEDPEEGAITIDGTDLRLIRRHSLRSIAGIVQPDPYLLPGTLVENIRLANTRASIDAIVAASQAAEFDTFASKLPDGYATHIGNGGLQLTVDQRERLSLTRAMVRQPALLIFEQPRGSLDAAAETGMLQTIQRLQPTILTVTESSACAAIADRIIVLDNGRVVAQGSHNDLMMQRGLYWRLWTDQHRDRDVIDPAILAQMPLFAGLEPTDLSAINRRLRIVQEPAGKDIVCEYAVADAFYMIEAGVVEVIATGAAGPKRVNVLGPGSFFGEIALLEMHALRTATVRALTPVRLYRLDKGDFLDLFRMHPSIASRVASESRQRLDQLRTIQ